MWEQGGPLGHEGAVVSQAASEGVTGDATGSCHDLMSAKETSAAAGHVPSQTDTCKHQGGTKSVKWAQLLAPSYS